MKRYIVILGLILIGAFGLLISDKHDSPAEDGKITGFSATDIPYDDGMGVLLKWKPLHKSNRVIQYNIYRGVHPDSLFFLSHLEVDPKLGVLSDELFFYDKDYPTLVDFETAPAKLKKEKQQGQDSPLFRGVPRDPKILGQLVSRYSVLGVINSSTFYKHSKEIVEADSSVFAGYKLNQFEYLLASTLPNQKYYYSVLAVNERGKLLPYADVQEVVPVDNRPDPTANLNTVSLTDNGEMRFEWNPPSAAKDILLWEGWLVPKVNLEAFRQAQELDAQNPQGGDYSALWKSGATNVFQIQNNFVSPVYYHTQKLADLGMSSNPDPSNYAVILGYMDYNGLYAYTLGKEIHPALSKDLPRLPEFTVLDKENDKGDNLYISLGKPLTFITQASYTNKQRNRLRINYELSTNDAYKLDKIKFVFLDSTGKDLGTVIEHFPDQIIHLAIPQGASENLSDITVKISVKVSGERDFGSEELIQHLEYDSSNRRFGGNRIEVAGQKLNKMFFDILTQTRLDSYYTTGNRMGAISRSYDHSIPYEDILYKSLSGYDAKSRRFKVDPNVVVAADTVNGDFFSVPLYKDAFEKQMQNLRDEIASLKSQIAVTTDAATLDSLKTVLSFNEQKLSFGSTHPATLAAAKKNGMSWLKVFLKERDKNYRSYSYQVLVTDGKGLYNLSTAYTKDGSKWFYPENEWFDNTKWVTLIGSIILILLVGYGIFLVRKKDPYIRPIAGLEELNNAVGRATEMGRPVMFVPGWGTLGDPCTISAMMILAQIARKTAEYDIRLISPQVDYFVVPVAQEMVKTSYSEVGRPDSYNQNDIFFVSDVQFAFSAAVNGITIRDRVATIFYMGYFNAEALLMTETGNQTGAIQIAATDAITQIPFFITTCDYTLIGEEFYASSAYLSKDPDLVSMLKAQDYFKLLIVITVLVGAILSSMHINGFVNVFPVE